MENSGKRMWKSEIVRFHSQSPSETGREDSKRKLRQHLSLY